MKHVLAARFDLRIEIQEHSVPENAICNNEKAQVS